MKKLTVLSVIFLGFLSGCYQASQPNIAKKENVIRQTGNDIKVSFKIKDAASASRIKSVDAYLIKNYNNPLDPASNAYSSGYKFQTDVTDGVFSIVFKNSPVGGPYYVAIQAFDNTIDGLPRNNITAPDDSLALDNKVARSSEHVTVYGNRLDFSEGNEINVTINLIPFNELPLDISPQNGSNTPTKVITLG